MASRCCSCRTSALRTFVRSIAQVHFPNEHLARAAPWREIRRQLHQRGTATWPVVSSLPHRSIHDSATDTTLSAIEMEEGQRPLEEGGQRQDSTSVRGDTPGAAATSQSHAASGGSTAPYNPLAEEVELFEAVHLSSVAKRKRVRGAIATQNKTRPASSPDLERRQQSAPIYDGATEDTEVGKTSILKEIEAEQRARELDRLRLRAERAKAKEQAKKEQERQKEREKRQREKERMKALPDWAVQKAALKAKFPEGWRPRKKLSPDALNGIRALNQQFPGTYTTQVLADKFEVSPEAIRRILRSKWEAEPEVQEDRERRWHNRGVNIWQHYAAIGKKPPVRWREAGVAVQSQSGRDRGRDKADHGDAFAGYDESENGMDAAAEWERVKRLRRQQKLAKHLF